MPKRRRSQVNSVTARLLLSLTRNAAMALFETETFGSCADDVMLCAAVWIGQVEGRPMSSTKIAGYAGIPRPTVIRKLAALRSRGVLISDENGRWQCSMNGGRADTFRAFADDSKLLINRAAATLSKMDTQAIAGREKRRLDGIQDDTKEGGK